MGTVIVVAAFPPLIWYHRETVVTISLFYWDGVWRPVD